MASVSSQMASPHPSHFDLDAAADTDGSWQFLDPSSGSSAPGSVTFFPSPATGSLAGFAVVGHASPPPVSVSPLSVVDMDQPGFLPAGPPSLPELPGLLDSGTFAAAGDGGFALDEDFLTPQQYLFPQGDIGGLAQQELDVDGLLFPGPDQANALQPFMSDPNAQPWNPLSPRRAGGLGISLDDMFPSPDERRPSTPYSSSAASPPAKSRTSSRSPVVGAKVEKKKAEQAGKFVIMTPTSISQAGRPNPFECFEAMRATQRGRKGPLAQEAKHQALQVRRRGACFGCHSRKVKCDEERPCRHCKRLMLLVPQVVCWQFQDFIAVLFPAFIRGHFAKDDMASFLRDNVDGFLVGGRERPCAVELSSGPRFSATLSVRAKFFTAKTCDVLQHWHMDVDTARIRLQSNGSAPIGVEFSAAQRDELRRAAKAYVQDIVNEPLYAEQVTDSLRSTKLPTKILAVVQRFARQSDSPMAKRALSIYAMHYVMTRHLCMTRQSIVSLRSSGLVPQNTPWVTPRVLARQVKSLVDELITREVQQLFELFTKSLKPKSRREWAPCTAAFLVLCLFMEAVETTAENFTASQNQINMKNSSPPEYGSDLALKTCRELENLPFKQFAYQFHNIYQTHTRDANTKSFNPLFDDSVLERGELDGPAVELVMGLRELFHGESWQDLQFLADDGILLDRDPSAFPIDASFLYTGRLVSKFLLSFTNEHIIFGSSI